MKQNDRSKEGKTRSNIRLTGRNGAFTLKENSITFIPNSVIDCRNYGGFDKSNPYGNTIRP